jgi:capsular exopolysaccharide synthesis family protein
MPASPLNRAPLPIQDGPLASVPAVLKALRKHWAVVVACFFVGSVAALLYAKSQTKIYEAATMIEIDPNPVPVLDNKESSMLAMGAGPFSDAEEYYTTQYRIITSQGVLNAVARDLSLASDHDFMGHGASSAMPPSAEAAGSLLAAHVAIEPIKASRLAYIKVRDTNPKRAKRLSDAIANAYIEQNLQQAVDASSEAVTWLDGQIDHLKGQLETSENKLYEFKQKNDLPSTSINESSNMLRLEMGEFDMALTHTRTRKQEILARAEGLAKVSPDNPTELPSSELLADTQLTALRMQYQEALNARDALIAENKGENHPLVRVAESHLATAKEALLTEVRNVQGAVQRDLEIITRQEAGESTLFERARRVAVDLNMKEIEYHRLERDRDQSEKLFALLSERLKEADLSRMMKVNNVRVVEAAAEPGEPISPRVSVNVLIGAGLGLLLGLAFAWGREQLDTSLKTPDDLEQRLGVTFLGLLPQIDDSDEPRYGRRKPRSRLKDHALESPELVGHNLPLSGLAEAARAIRTNLVFMNPDRPHRKLLVTSAAPAEGKTTVACSIAIALAQGGQRVCIVDCDLRRSRLHRIFNRVGEAGVTNVLVGEATLDEVAKPTGIDNLWSIPAGPTPPNPADIFHSERFRQFIADLGDRFDRVVIDSPPLVAVTDAVVLATLVDGTVFVVRAFKTSRHLSSQGLRSLRDVDAPVVGAVLNAVNLSRHEYSNYYHYYYYKREGYPSTSASDGEEPRAGAAPV